MHKSEEKSIIGLGSSTLQYVVTYYRDPSSRSTVVLLSTVPTKLKLIVIRIHDIVF